MTELKNVDEKELIAKEIKEMVKRINDIIDTAPPSLRINVYQNNLIGSLSKNAHVSVFIDEKISY